MFVVKTLIFCAAWVAVQSQNYGPTTTPVPILKQINKQNDDGSYSFGYEAADGSFKIETKYPNGDVAGKYGYVDDSGKLKEISYGATKERGFEPQGSGIMVPPPTLHEQPTSALADGQEDDGQYREDPRIYEDPKYNGKTRNPSAAFRQFQQPAQPVRQTIRQPTQPQYQEFKQSYQPQETYQQQNYQPQNYEPQPRPNLFTQSSLFNQAPQQFPQEQRPQSQVYHQQPQFSYQAFTPQPNQYQPQTNQPQPQTYQPQPQTYQPQTYQPQTYQPQNYQTQNYNPFTGHPAQNFDPSTGSYSINFTG